MAESTPDARAELVDQLRASARSHTRAIAVAHDGRSWSFAAVDGAAARLAADLRELGVGPGVPVVVVAEPGVELIIAMLASLMVGGVYAPVSLSSADAHGVKLLARTGDGVSVLAGVAADDPRLARHAAALPKPVLVVTAPSEGHEPERPVDLPAVDPSDFAYLFCTSASSGAAKAVRGSANSLLHFCRWFAAAFNHRPGARISQLASPSFDASLKDVLPALLAGATVCIPPSSERDPLALASWIDEAQLTHLQAVPSLWRLIAAELEPRKRPLRHVLLSGERLHPREVRGWATRLGPEVELVNLYGLTEATILQSCQRELAASLTDDSTAVSIGTPIAGYELFIHTAPGRRDEPGTTGPLYIASPYLSLGYLDPAHDPASFVADPRGGSTWVCKTGDIARREACGSLTILGRRDAQVKFAGIRLDLGELEALLLASGASEAIVSLRGEFDDQELVAHVVTEVAESTLRAALHQSLGPRAKLLRLVAMTELPRTITGKADRRALRAMPLPKPESSGTPPRPGTEAVLAQIWAEILSCAAADIARETSFFDLGGTSISAIRMLGRVRKQFGVSGEIRAVFAEPSLAAIASMIDDHADDHDRAEPRPIPDAPSYPLTEPQRGVWIRQLARPDDEAYVAHAVYAVEGPLDRGRLEAAFAELVERHEILRTRVRVENREPRQVIEAPGTWPARIGQFELGEGKLDEPVIVPREGFDLERGPLVRVRVAQRGPQRHLLHVAMHQLICDEWSTALFVSELLQRCDDGGAAHERKPTTSGARPLQYRDFAGELATGQGALATGVREFWRAQMHPPPRALAIGTSGESSERGGARISLEIERALLERCRSFARDRDTTVFVVLRAVLATLVHLHTGALDQCLAAPLALRDAAGSEDQLGLFAELVPLRLRFDPDERFVDLVERTKAHTLAVLEHRRFPLAEILHGVDADVLNVVFAYNDVPSQRVAGSSLHARPLATDNHSSKFDLTLLLRPEGQSLSGALEYRRARMSAAEAQRFARQFVTLCASAVSQPELAAGDLHYDDHARWGDDARTAPTDLRTLSSAFAATVARHGDAPALQHRKRVWTYAALAAETRNVAAWLRDRGLGRGDLIGVCCESPFEAVVAVLAVLEIGAAYLPLDAEAPDARRAAMIERVGPALILGDREIQAARASSPNHTRTSPGPEPGDLAYVIFTSGSTGAPKPVAVEHRSVMSLLQPTVFPLAVGPGDAWLMFHRLAFDFSVWELFGALVHGCRLVLLDPEQRRDPLLTAGLIRSARVTVLNQVPSAFWAVADSLIARPEPLALRYLIFGGEPLIPTRLARWRRRFPEIEILNMFGITETCVHVTVKQIRDEDVVRSRSVIGRPLRNATVVVVDPRGRPVPPHVAGELWITGPGVARGYLGDPEQTAARFATASFAPGHRFYRSGDLGAWTEDGELVHLGRCDRQVQIRGYRIEPGEVEVGLEAHPAVTRAHVCACDAANDGVMLVGYYVGEVEEAELRDHAARRLPNYMIPERLLALAEFPLGPNGKIDEHALPEPRTARTSVDARSIVSLADLFAEVLDRESVELDDDLFALGGHSLSVVQLVGRVAQSFGRKLTVADVFAARTPRALRERIERAPRALPQLDLEPLAPAPDYALSPAQVRMFFADRLRPADASVDHEPFALELPGDVDPQRLRACLVELCARHQILASTFAMVGDEPRERPADPEQMVRLELVDAPPDAAPEQAIESARRTLARDRFVVETGSPCRFTLVRLGPDRALLLIALHHLVSDHESYYILADELLAALDPGDRSPGSAAQFHDYAAWIRRYQATAAGSRELGFWRATLAGLDAPRFPVDVPSSRRRAALAEVRELSIDVERCAALRELAREQATTLFVVLQAAVRVVVHARGYGPDVVLGTPVSTRIDPALERMIGPLFNVLILRGEVSPSATVTELLAQVHGVTTDALNHRLLPLEPVITEASTSRVGLPFDVGFTLQTLLGRGRLDSTRLIEHRASRTAAIATALWFEAAEREGLIRFRVYFQRGLFDPKTIAALMADLARVCAELPLASERAVWELLGSEPDDRVHVRLEL